jgi:hypothetical protein
MRPLRPVLLSAAVVLLATVLSPARTPTGYSAIKGTWLNPNSGALVKLVIWTDSTGRLFLHAYGACSPTPCDWGTVYPSAWSGGPGSAKATAVTASYGSSLSSAVEILTANLVYVTGQPTRLRVNLFTHFNRDLRYDFFGTELMSK